MTTITLKFIEPQLAQRLQQRANENGRTVEAEIATILSSVLIPKKAEDNIAKEEDEVDLATAIKRRFESVGGFDLPEIPRDPIRQPPSF
ncbi:MAG: plasmid stability protein [Cyanobacteria bacterium J06555_13]